MKKPLCTKCIHFYTTWETSFPYGCKAMGIKSAASPADVVRRASGQDCLAYMEKLKNHNQE